MVTTRFAPSPTGHLHIGGARTALYAWLFARHHHGKFILRIEDTDRERSTQEAVDAILQSMTWLGLEWDEGPYYQTKRMDRYNEVLNQLLNEGKAYRCRCSKERLLKLREQQTADKQKPRYDGHCRDLNLPDSEDVVIRFRNPVSGAVEFVDKVRGKISIQNAELDDLILARSDGNPTYNFTVVVDDFDMKVTHVIRGDDHINNTPRQINILLAMGAHVPTYAHVPMILGPDGKRYSKRHGAESVMQYHLDGYLPEAILNYLIRLGWSHGDQEVFSREEMIEKFNLDSLNNSPAMFNFEKLNWLNQYYMKLRSVNELAELVTENWHLNHKHPNIGPKLDSVIPLLVERSKTIKEMATQALIFYDDVELNDDAKKLLTKEIIPAFEELQTQLKSLQAWQKESIHEVIKDSATKLNLKMGQIAQPTRAATTGTTNSPPIDITLQLLGKEKTLERLNNAIQRIQQNSL